MTRLSFYRICRSIALVLALLVCGAGISGCNEQEPSAQEQTADEAHTKPDKVPVSRETTLGPVHAVVTLSDGNPTLGETVELTLSVDSAPDVAVTMPDFGDQLGKFSIADYRSSEKAGEDGRTVRLQSYTLDLPMSGKLRTPSFLVEFTDNRDNSENKGKLQELLTEEITFDVASVFGDGEVPETLFPAKGELGELVLPEKKSSHLWIGLLAILACVGIAGFVIARKRRRPEVIVPPDVIALRALDEMQAKDIPTESKAVDAWYVELSSIVRNYIEGRFSLHAPRLTTEEFFEIAKRSTALSDDNKALIRKLLEYSDRVKFTDYIPDRNMSIAMLEDARKFVVDTREVAE